MNLVRLQYGGGSSIEPYTVIVSLDEDFKGQPVTLTQGTEIMRKTCPTTTPYEVEFKPMNDGVWVASSTTKDGKVVSVDTEPLLEWGIYYMTLKSGFELQEWLNRGRVEKTFTSLDDVLADQQTVRQLMTVHASCEYLYESYLTDNTILDTIMNSTYGAKWLGLRDYVCDKFMANETAKATMLNSDNWEYILKDKVPTMTSDTAPEGECKASSIYNTYYAWNAFDGNDSTNLCTTAGSDSNWVYYKFTNPIAVYKTEFIEEYGNKHIKIQISNDGTNWEDITETITTIAKTSKFINSKVIKYALFVRLLQTETTSLSLFTLQFYGRSLNESVPVMPDNTMPIGEAISKTNPTEAFNAFDNDSNSTWNGSLNGSDIGYKSIKSICVKSIIIGDEANVSSTMEDNTRLKNFIVQGSNSGEFNGEEEDIYVGIYEKKKTDLSNALQKFDFIDNNKNFLYHRVLIVDKYASANNYGIRLTKLQFYGVSYSEEEFGDEGIEMLYDNGVKMCDFVATFDETEAHPTITEESDHILFEVPSYSRFTVTQYIAQKEINNSDGSFKYSIHESSYCSVSQTLTQRGSVCLTKNQTGYGTANSEIDIMTNTNTAYKRKIINKIDTLATPYASFSSRALNSNSYIIKWVKLYLIKKGA